MADELEIVRIQASPSVPRGSPDLETGEQPRWIDVAITVRNSTSKTLYVMSGIRRLQYDAGTHTLQLSLKEPEPAPSGQAIELRNVVLPDFTPVPPGETVTIRVSVPEVINRIRSVIPTEAGLEYERIDISGLQQIHCVIAHRDAPFQPQPGASPDEIRRQLASWGQTVERTLPARNGRSPDRQES